MKTMKAKDAGLSVNERSLRINKLDEQIEKLTEIKIDRIANDLRFLGLSVSDLKIKGING